MAIFTPALQLLAHHPRYFKHLLIKKIQFRQRYRWMYRQSSGHAVVPAPLVYKLILTWKCNLSCRMCMLWGNSGWKKKNPAGMNEEMSWQVIERVFRQLPYNASFVLSGGEPLLYSQMEQLLSLLQKHKTFATICTNGTRLHALSKALDGNPYPTFLVSLDGLEPENDAIRGKGVFARVVQSIQDLKALKRPPYLGIQFTVRPDNVHVMRRFCKEMVKLGVDWILLNPTWFVSEKQACSYERFMQDRFNIMPKTHLGYLAPFPIDKETFIAEYEKIRRDRWPIQISCYLKDPESIYPFIDDPQKLIGNDVCAKQWLRIDILPDGTVTPCVQFPDMTFGNVTSETLPDVWNSPAYQRFRSVIRREPLPVCSKCNNIYLYDANRKYL